MPEAAPWRTIDELARAVGGYCWLESRIFALTGSWASDDGDPTVRVFFSEVSARHAGWAAQWRDRLPVRAGVDLDALVVDPDDGVSHSLAACQSQTTAAGRLDGLISGVLPLLMESYRTLLDGAFLVNEAPVIEILGPMVWSGEREVDSGQKLVKLEMK
jgi:hypothetical protein